MSQPVNNRPQSAIEYERGQRLSTDILPDHKWKAVVAALMLATTIIAAVALLAAAGAFDPRRGLTNATVVTNGSALNAHRRQDGWTLLQLSAPVAAPFALEVVPRDAVAGGEPWGVWIGSDGAETLLLADPQGYVSSGPTVDWRPFIHVAPVGNRLLLTVAADGAATWRVNGEVAWTADYDASAVRAGIVQAAGVDVDGLVLRLLAP